MQVNSSAILIQTYKKTYKLAEPKNNLKESIQTSKYNSDLSSLSNTKITANTLQSINLFPHDTVIYSGNGNIFPSSWLSSRIKPKASEVKNEYKNLSKGIIENSVNKYPSNVILNNLENTYLVGSLSCYGVKYSGTNSKKSVYVLVNGRNDIEKTFHHEFSSILLRNNSDKLNLNEWRNLGRSNNTSSQAAVQSGQSSLDFDEKLLQKGYLCEYSLSNLENDFNMYAENLFAGGKQFWDAVDKYPKVRAKTDLIINFYNKIDSSFTEDYFRALAK